MVSRAPLGDARRANGPPPQPHQSPGDQDADAELEEVETRASPPPAVEEVFSGIHPLERVLLRRGNHASAKFWRRLLLPVIARYRHWDIPKFFRGDAAFAIPALYGVLEEEGYRCVIRLKANSVLEREISHLLTRPVGRPSHRPTVFYHSIQYQAKSWQS